VVSEKQGVFMKTISNHFTAVYSVVRDWNLVRFFVALILLVAASLKAYQLATEPVLGDGLFHARWFNVFVVEFELFFGTWLIFGMLPRLTWLASVGLFSVFSSISLYKAVSGETSCGCFGVVTVSPWITSVFDVVVVGLLLFVKPIGIVFNIKNFYCEIVGLRKRGRIVVLAIVWLIVAVPITYIMLAVEKNVDELGYEFVGADSKKMFVLEPEKWIGKEFPLLPFLDEMFTNRIMEGSKDVVLFRFDCDECKSLIEKIKDKDSYIFVEIPSEESNVPLFSVPEYMSLSGSREWWVETPVVFSLEKTIIKRVTRNVE
jgi:hypothetical protein